MPVPIDFDADSNLATSGGQSLVFHCHFYNCALQKAVEEGLGASAAEVLSEGAALAVYAQLQNVVADPAAALTMAEDTYRQLGFGALDLGGARAEPPAAAEAVVHASHYAMGWLAVHGERDTVCCHFAAGFVRAAVATARGVSLDAIQVAETQCFACGADVCRFRVEARP